jgi:hypothetical protein
MADDADGRAGSPAPCFFAASAGPKTQWVRKMMNLLHGPANLQDSVIFTLQQPLARSQAEACKFRSVHRRTEFLAHI